MTTTVKITELADIGANLASSTVVPVVNMAGTPITQKTNVGNIANLILEGAGVDYPEASVALLAQTVSNAAQPNITSTGTLSTLTVSGNTSLGAVANVKITGGSSGQVLRTDGAGNLSWVAQSGGGGTPGGSTTQVQFNDAGAFAGEGNFTYDSANHILNVTRANSSFLTAYESVATANLSANGIANIARINVTNTANLGAVGNVTITGGSAGQKLTTDGAGGLSWTNDANSSYGNSNVAAYLPTYTGNLNGNMLTIQQDVNGNGALRLQGIANGNSTINIGGEGDIDVVANVGNINLYTANNQPWVFGDDGYLTLPGQSAIGPINGANSIGIGASANKTIVLGTNNGSNSFGWSFQPDGTLSLPDDGVIASYSNVGDKSYIGFIGSVTNDVTIATEHTDNLKINLNQNGTNVLWTFDYTGNVTLPGNTFAVKYANGSTVQIGTNTGNIGFNGNAITNTQNQPIIISPSFSGPGNASITVPDNANAANGQATTITNLVGNVKVRSGNGSNVAEWDFTNTGVLHFPDGSQFGYQSANITGIGASNNQSITFATNNGVAGSSLTYNANSVLDMYSAQSRIISTNNTGGTSFIAFVGSTFPNMVLGTNGPNNVAINVDSSNANLVWAFESSGALKFPGNTIAEDNIEGTGNFGFETPANVGFGILTNAGDNEWAFGSDGNLTLPNNAKIAISGTSTLLNSSPNGFLGLNTYAGGNNIARVNISSLDELVSIGISNPITEIDYNWTFATGGGTIFPTVSVQRGDNPSGTITGQTLLFGDDTQEAIISTPDGTTGNEYSQRLVINPGAGSNFGEGGDIYLWAGRGGNGSGSGGDIKIRGGQGGANTQGGNGGDGGYIRIEAGDGASTGGAAGYINITGGQNNAGSGGYVNVTGGYGTTVGGEAKIYGGYGQATGGNVNIWGGGSGSGQPNEGHVNIQTGGNTWSFDTSGNLTLPQGGSIFSMNSTPSGAPGNTIILQPAGSGITTNQKLLVYPTAADGDHIHMTSGNLYETELFLGSDNLYVKLANTGNIVINSNDDNGNSAMWTFDYTGNLTLPNSSVLTFGDTPVTNRYYVDATRTDTYTQNGSQARPFKTIAGAQAAIATAISGGLNPEVEPIYIILLSNITEDVTLATNHVYLVGQSGQIHQPIILSGNVTVNPTSGTLGSNHFSITGIEVVGGTNGKAIYVTGTSPLRLSLQDVWITANGTGAGLYQDNTGTGTYTHGGPLKVSHNGSGDVYCFNILKGTASFDTVETSGATQVGAAGPGATLTFNNSQLDANGDVVVETYGNGAVVVTNSVIKNSQANGFGVKLNAVSNVAGTVSIGQSAFNVPTGTGSAVWLDPNTTAGLSGVLAYSGVSFYPSTNTTLSATLIPAPLTTLVGTIASPIMVGDITATGTAQDWDLIDNNASALSFDTTGKAGILNIVTTNSSEGVTMSGYANVTGNITGGNISTSGNISGNTNGYTIGYLNIPQVAASNTTLALTDAGKHYYSTTAGNFTLTVPNNTSASFSTGTAISIVVQAAGNILVNAASGVTLYMAGNSTAANRVVGSYGMATLMKVATDTWFINGTGVS